MAEGTHSVSMWGCAISPCTRSSKVSAGQERLWALSREEGKDRDRSWGHANPRLCVPQFLKNKPCCWMKYNQVPQSLQGLQLLPSSSCDPFSAQGFHHHLQTFTQCCGYGWHRSIHLTPPLPRQAAPGCSQA